MVKEMWLGDPAIGAKGPEKAREARAREGTEKAGTRGNRQAEDLSDRENNEDTQGLTEGCLSWGEGM